MGTLTVSRRRAVVLQAACEMGGAELMLGFNCAALRRDLEEHLGAEAYTKAQARQVVIRGDWTREVKEVLGANGF